MPVVALKKQIKKPAGALNPRAGNYTGHNANSIKKREQRKWILTLAVTD